jgi:hypothetical protein
LVPNSQSSRAGLLLASTMLERTINGPLAVMRIRIIKEPPIASIDGIRLDYMVVGRDYEVGNSLGALLLAEGWAEPVALNAPALVVPFSINDPFDSRMLYRDAPNLVQEREAPVPDHDIAADRVAQTGAVIALPRRAPV